MKTMPFGRVLALVLFAALPFSTAHGQLLPDIDVDVDVEEDVDLPDVDDVEDAVGIGNDRGGDREGLGTDRNVIDYSAVIEAVRERRALPLADLLAVVAGSYDGQVIDVRLLLVGGMLVYEVKMVGAGGIVSSVFLNAENGRPAARP